MAIWRDAAKARSWWDKLRIWWMPPGWRPQDVAEGRPKDGFDIEVQRYYDPQLTRSSQWLLAMLLAASLGRPACCCGMRTSWPCPSSCCGRWG